MSELRQLLDTRLLCFCEHSIRKTVIGSSPFIRYPRVLGIFYKSQYCEDYGNQGPDNWGPPVQNTNPSLEFTSSSCYLYISHQLKIIDGDSYEKFLVFFQSVDRLVVTWVFREKPW